MRKIAALIVVSVFLAAMQAQALSMHGKLQSVKPGDPVKRTASSLTITDDKSREVTIFLASNGIVLDDAFKRARLEDIPSGAKVTVSYSRKKDGTLEATLVAQVK